MTRRRDRTYYSEKIDGARGNYDWPVRFDITNGYVGITQFDGDVVKDKVLLSPAQVTALFEFVSPPKAKRAA